MEIELISLKRVETIQMLITELRDILDEGIGYDSLDEINETAQLLADISFRKKRRSSIKVETIYEKVFEMIDEYQKEHKEDRAENKKREEKWEKEGKPYGYMNLPDEKEKEK